MLQRLLVSGLLIFGATVLDLGLPTWTSAPVLPLCLDLLLILFCLELRSGELVALAGLLGLCHSHVLGTSSGVGIMIAATVALLVAVRQSSSGSSLALTDRLLSGSGILLLLTICRVASVWLARTDQPLAPLLSASLLRSAMTLLVLVLVCSLWSGIQLLRRRTYFLEKSCL